MFCARLDHFVRMNANGSIGKCGHMIESPGFASWPIMQDSQWLADVKKTFEQDRWPKECRRCQDTEASNGESVRKASNQRHQILSRMREDYLVLGGVLDNVCNSACQSCSASHSTKIGSLLGRHYPRVDNTLMLEQLPWESIIEIDISGGEPTASPRYQKLLENLPPNVKIIRVNTNGSRLLPNIENILAKQIFVTITVSLDGIESVHDYVRWPIRWADFVQTLEDYKDLRDRYHNLRLQSWTVVHALNIADLDNIKIFTRDNEIEHSWAYLHQPRPLDVRFSNSFTTPYKYLQPDLVASMDDNQQELDKFIQEQDRLRGIDIGDYI